MRKTIPTLCACLIAIAAVAAGAAAKRTHRSAGTDAKTVSGLDKQYLKTSLQGDLFEIDGAKIAFTHTRNKAVRTLAARLQKDHTKSFEEAAKLARKLGVEVPKSPTPTEVWELRTIARWHGRAFNRAYATLEVYDHEQDVSEAIDETSDGSNAEVVADAKTELPTLKQHLRLAEKTVRAVH